MKTILEPMDVLKAILAAGRNGKPAPRVVTATILFTEDGDILTQLVDSRQFHMKNGADFISLLMALVPPQSAIIEPEQITDKRGKRIKGD
jgi:hypothetical protein